MHDLAHFCCQNPDRSLYGRRDAGNLSVCGRLGKQERFRQLYCNACRARFSERKGTPLYRCHLPEEKALAVLEHLDEGCGVRPTGRLLNRGEWAAQPGHPPDRYHRKGLPPDPGIPVRGREFETVRGGLPGRPPHDPHDRYKAALERNEIRLCQSLDLGQSSL
jgi:LacI family transcriptional regulator